MFLSRAKRVKRMAPKAAGNEPEGLRLVDEETFFKEVGKER
jgi:hypothetical protein